jgi:hypothetical protein
MDKTPQLIQLTLADRQPLPQIQQEVATMTGGPIQPGTDRILVNVDDPCGTAQRISFGQGANRDVKNGWVGFQLKIGCPIPQHHTLTTGPTDRLFVAATGAIFDQQALPPLDAIQAASRIRTVQGFPIHDLLARRPNALERGYQTCETNATHHGY